MINYFRSVPHPNCYGPRFMQQAWEQERGRGKGGGERERTALNSEWNFQVLGRKILFAGYLLN